MGKLTHHVPHRAPRKSAQRESGKPCAASGGAQIHPHPYSSSIRKILRCSRRRPSEWQWQHRSREQRGKCELRRTEISIIIRVGRQLKISPIMEECSPRRPSRAPAEKPATAVFQGSSFSRKLADAALTKAYVPPIPPRDIGESVLRSKMAIDYSIYLVPSMVMVPPNRVKTARGLMFCLCIVTWAAAPIKPIPPVMVRALIAVEIASFG